MAPNENLATPINLHSASPYTDILLWTLPLAAFMVQLYHRSKILYDGQMSRLTTGERTLSRSSSLCAAGANYDGEVAMPSDSLELSSAHLRSFATLGELCELAPDTLPSLHLHQVGLGYRLSGLLARPHISRLTLKSGTLPSPLEPSSCPETVCRDVCRDSPADDLFEECQRGEFPGRYCLVPTCLRTRRGRS
jgi:hypothetical protein